LFAAGVADVAFASAAITGRELRVDRSDPAAPRIALVRTHAWDQAEPAMRQAVEATARRAATAGAAVTEFDHVGFLEDAEAAHAVINRYEAYRALAFEYDNHRDALGPMLRAMLDEGATIAAEDYDAARRTAKRARQAFADFMSGADSILTPAAAGAAPRGFASTGLPAFNRAWTLLGAPCVNVPGLADTAGMPLGLQVVGRFGRDRAALEAAAFVEGVIERG
jgi:Asp-tRNA(Asn)/Glu-tRNA(Gln) amidotransferase A subunit family amidase